MVKRKFDSETVRKNLQVLLKRMNISQRRFADMAGIDQSNFIKKFKGIQSITDLDLFKMEKAGISMTFLLTGTGDIFSAPQESNETIVDVPAVIENPKGIPVYDQEFSCGFLTFDGAAVIPSGYAEMPGTTGACCWCKATGNSMEPQIYSGDYVCLRKVDDWNRFLVFGDTYAIDTFNDMRSIKRIDRGEKENEFTLTSLNPEYKPQTIEISMIRTLFKVVAVSKLL